MVDLVRCIFEKIKKVKIEVTAPKKAQFFMYVTKDDVFQVL